MFRVVPRALVAIVLSGGLLLGLLPPMVSAHAEDQVAIVAVQVERFGIVTRDPQGRSVRLHVSITCDGTGHIGDLEFELEQRASDGTISRGVTNLDLLDAPCTTVPTRYTINIDNPGGGFRPGASTVTRITEFFGFTTPPKAWPAGQRVILLFP